MTLAELHAAIEACSTSAFVTSNVATDLIDIITHTQVARAHFWVIVAVTKRLPKIAFVPSMFHAQGVLAPDANKSASLLHPRWEHLSASGIAGVRAGVIAGAKSF